jgi:hypothetical protein
LVGIATLAGVVGAVFGAIALLVVARLHRRMFSVKDAARRIPNINSAATPRPSFDDFGSQL